MIGIHCKILKISDNFKIINHIITAMKFYQKGKIIVKSFYSILAIIIMLPNFFMVIFEFVAG